MYLCIIMIVMMITATPTKASVAMEQNGDRRSRLIHLSFDDGPNIEIGDQLLDLLASHNISASFFIVASHLFDESYGDEAWHPSYDYQRMTRRMLTDGHMIGSHTWSHHVFQADDTRDVIINEVQKAQTMIGEVTGIRPYLFRAPRGQLPSGRLTSMIHDMNYTICRWDIDSLDWTPLSTHSIIEQLLSHWALQPLDDIIATNDTDIDSHTNGMAPKSMHMSVMRLLFHEKKRTLTHILPYVIPVLVARGFTFVPLAQTMDHITLARLFDQYQCDIHVLKSLSQYYQWCRSISSQLMLPNPISVSRPIDGAADDDDDDDGRYGTISLTSRPLVGCVTYPFEWLLCVVVITIVCYRYCRKRGASTNMMNSQYHMRP